MSLSNVDIRKLNKMVPPTNRPTVKLGNIINNLLAAFGPGTTRYVNWDNGVDTGDGLTWGGAFKTLQYAIDRSVSYDTILVTGTTAAEPAATIPSTVTHLTIQGIGPTTDATHWKSSAGVTLLTVNSVGCRVTNMFIQPPATAGIGILLPQGSKYFTVDGCRFQGSANSAAAIKTTGGDNVRILDNEFTLFNKATDGTAILGIMSDPGGWISGGWLIQGNRFLNTTRCIHTALRASVIKDNIIQAVGIGPGAGASTTFVEGIFIGPTIEASNGEWNIVTGNTLGGDYSTAKYSPGANDDWTGNFSADTAEAEVGDNGITIGVPVA